MDYSTILVIGGSGFIGSHLVAQLVAAGRRVIVPTRRNDRARHLLVLPTVDIVEANVHDDTTLGHLVQRADAVINLVGVLHAKAGPRGSSYGPGFARPHVDLPKKIIRACEANGVPRYLHMSALGAAANAPSMYLRSKAAGEAAVSSSATVATTIFRPSVVFGPEDHFLNLFASLQKFLPVMLIGSPDAKFQPVYVVDVALAFVNALENRATFGKTFELAGPTVYTLRELVRLAGLYSGHRRPVIGLPPVLARLQALLLEYMPGGPLMSRDNLASMQLDNVAAAPMDPHLKVTPTPLEAVAPFYLSVR
ncbi:MAG: complex I NDUFA9 subunit family protein [Pseudomonadota bacterium]